MVDGVVETQQTTKSEKYERASKPTTTLKTTTRGRFTTLIQNVAMRFSSPKLEVSLISCIISLLGVLTAVSRSVVSDYR